MQHAVNWYAGWSLILAAFLAGAVIGLRFAQEEFLGGYASWRRRLLRLGHIAAAALGLINVVYAISPAPSAGWRAAGASIGLAAGAVAMPAVCFLSAWHKPMRAFFFIPVCMLAAAVALIIAG